MHSTVHYYYSIARVCTQMRWERKELSHLLGERGPGVQEERVQRSRHVRRLQELEGKRKRTQLMYQQAKSNEMAMRR